MDKNATLKLHSPGTHWCIHHFLYHFVGDQWFSVQNVRFFTNLGYFAVIYKGHIMYLYLYKILKIGHSTFQYHNLMFE